MVRRGKVAAKGATVIFCRLAGGEEEEQLALRVLLLDLDAIFINFAAKAIVAGPRIRERRRNCMLFVLLSRVLCTKREEPSDYTPCVNCVACHLCRLPWCIFFLSASNTYFLNLK